jgi:hypothetical protein
VGAPPLGSRFNKHFAPDLHAPGRLTIPYKIVKGRPADPMRRAKFRDRERNMVFHGCLHSPTMWPFASGVETRDPAQDPVAGF